MLDRAAETRSPGQWGPGIIIVIIIIIIITIIIILITTGHLSVCITGQGGGQGVLPHLWLGGRHAPQGGLRGGGRGDRTHLNSVTFYM